MSEEDKKKSRKFVPITLLSRSPSPETIQPETETIDDQFKTTITNPEIEHQLIDGEDKVKRVEHLTSPDFDGFTSYPLKDDRQTTRFSSEDDTHEQLQHNEMIFEPSAEPEFDTISQNGGKKTDMEERQSIKNESAAIETGKEVFDREGMYEQPIGTSPDSMKRDREEVVAERETSEESLRKDVPKTADDQNRHIREDTGFVASELSEPEVVGMGDGIFRQQESEVPVSLPVIVNSAASSFYDVLDEVEPVNASKEDLIRTIQMNDKVELNEVDIIKTESKVPEITDSPLIINQEAKEETGESQVTPDFELSIVERPNMNISSKEFEESTSKTKRLMLFHNMEALDEEEAINPTDREQADIAKEDNTAVSSKEQPISISDDNLDIDLRVQHARDTDDQAQSTRVSKEVETNEQEETLNRFRDAKDGISEESDNLGTTSGSELDEDWTVGKSTIITSPILNSVEQIIEKTDQREDYAVSESTADKEHIASSPSGTSKPLPSILHPEVAQTGSLQSLGSITQSNDPGGRKTIKWSEHEAEAYPVHTTSNNRPLPSTPTSSPESIRIGPPVDYSGNADIDIEAQQPIEDRREKAKETSMEFKFFFNLIIFILLLMLIVALVYYLSIKLN